jgi:hypothetical protein
LGLNILLQFRKDLVRILSTRQPIHDLEFRKLDIYRIVVLAKENFDIILQDSGPSLNDQQYISEGNILNLGPGGKKGD